MIYEYCNSILWPNRHEESCQCCPKCKSTPDDHSVHNYNATLQDGDVYCNKCGTRVRIWDAS